MNLNPMAWLRASQNGNARAGAHMTFATTSVGRTISRTGVFLRKQIWIWPIIAVVLLSMLGLVVRRAMETAMLNTWYKVQQSNAQSVANGLDFRQTVYPLIEPHDASDGKSAPSPDV